MALLWEGDIKDSNYIVVQGWMVNRLKLSGNELMVYAIIYGFSQDGESKFEGSGKYIADSIGVSRRAVSIILNELVGKGFIQKIELRVNGLKFCHYRAAPGLVPEEKPEGGMENFSIGRKKFPGGMEKDSTGGMEKDSNYITNINNINNTAAAPPPPESSAGPPGDGESAAAALFEPQDLKKALQGLDKALVLDDAFYHRAGAFMARHGLDSGYLKWLCRQCENKESPANYLFKTFLLDTKAAQYKAIRQAAAESRPPPDADCPVCGTLHAKGDAACPICGLPKDSVPERILFLRGLWDFDPARHGEYLSREKELADGCGLKDYVRHKSLLENLQKEFSLETA